MLNFLRRSIVIGVAAILLLSVVGNVGCGKKVQQPQRGPGTADDEENEVEDFEDRTPESS